METPINVSLFPATRPKEKKSQVLWKSANDTQEKKKEKTHFAMPPHVAYLQPWPLAPARTQTAVAGGN